MPSKLYKIDLTIHMDISEIRDQNEMKTMLCLEISVVRHAVLVKPVAEKNRCLCFMPMLEV